MFQLTVGAKLLSKGLGRRNMFHMFYMDLALQLVQGLNYVCDGELVQDFRSLRPLALAVVICTLLWLNCWVAQTAYPNVWVGCYKLAIHKRFYFFDAPYILQDGCGSVDWISVLDIRFTSGSLSALYFFFFSRILILFFCPPCRGTTLRCPSRWWSKVELSSTIVKCFVFVLFSYFTEVISWCVGFVF